MTYPCPKQFEDQFPSWDHYIAHNTFACTTNAAKETFIILITDRNIYKYTTGNRKIWQRDIRDIHTIEPGSNRSFSIIYRFPKQGKLLSGGEDYLAQLHKETCEAESAEVKDMWLVMLSRVLRITNQKFFENSYVPAPEVYQWSVYVMKFNGKGKKQLRCLACSTQRLYNIDVKAGSLELGKTKWAFTISSCTSVIKYDNNPFIFTLNVAPGTPSGSYRSKPMGSMCSFGTRTELEKNWIIADVKRIFFICTKGHLKEETGVLKDSKVVKGKSSLILNDKGK